MDIKKYITNKDIELTNDDINIEKLTNDLRKGYVSNDDMEEKIKSAVDEVTKSSKSEFEKLKGEYDNLQNNLTEYEKRNTDLAERNKTLSLENVMTREGFKEEDFKDISAMRYSLFGEEKDDVKAIANIKEKYKNTYFPTQEPTKPKNDLPINNGTKEPEPIKVSRLTNIKDLLKK
jgi:FtsZ-binding cell division protein ZapB